MAAMSIHIIPKSQQGQGAFNGGEIVENKPIGFPQDHSSVRPYSNLFYWAHARAVVDSTIGLHPHQGFEICSFVLEGEIRHYDTAFREWRPLHAGDVQIIRAGNGISHSEWMGKDGEMFQIWFDPDLSKTLSQPASYDDYRAADFPKQQQGAVQVTTLVGEGSPFRMDAPGIRVQTLDFQEKGAFDLPLSEGQVASAYVVKGEAGFNGQAAAQNDFVIATETTALTLEAEAGARIFVIVSPASPGYATYAQLRRMQGN